MLKRSYHVAQLDTTPVKTKFEQLAPPETLRKSIFCQHPPRNLNGNIDTSFHCSCEDGGYSSVEWSHPEKIRPRDLNPAIDYEYINNDGTYALTMDDAEKFVNVGYHVEDVCMQEMDPKMLDSKHLLDKKEVYECGMSLHLVELRIPSHAVRNQSARLECHFDLDGETLYSVKWYKDGNEFYRFVPRDMPPAQVFPLPGVTVDMHNSTENQVVLSSVQLSTSGTYRCEVSGEAPFFQTVTEHGHMIVVALPEEGPRISGGRPRYQVGDTVRVNCTSGRSKPAAQLNWFINGEPADQSFLRGPETIITGREGLETSILGLEFGVRPKHFKRGDMKLKCLATIATVYWRSNEESVEGERPQRASVLESRGTVAPPGSRADRVQAAGSYTMSLPRSSIVTSCIFLVLLTALR